MKGLLEMDTQGCFMPQIFTRDADGNEILCDLNEATCDGTTRSLVDVTIAHPDTPTLADTYQCTPEHVWIVDEKEIAATELDGVVTAEGFMFRARTVDLDTPQKVFSIDVDDEHSFILAHRLCDYQPHVCC